MKIKNNDWFISNLLRSPLRHAGDDSLLFDDDTIEARPAYDPFSHRGFLGLAGMLTELLVERRRSLESAFALGCRIFLDIYYRASSSTIATVDEAEKSIWQAGERRTIEGRVWLESPTRVNESIICDLLGMWWQIEPRDEYILLVHTLDGNSVEFHNLIYPTGICGFAWDLAEWLGENEEFIRNLITRKWDVALTADLRCHHPVPSVMEKLRAAWEPTARLK
jgi:hypothetical protein